MDLLEDRGGTRENSKKSDYFMTWTIVFVPYMFWHETIVHSCILGQKLSPVIVGRIIVFGCRILRMQNSDHAGVGVLACEIWCAIRYED